MGEGISTRQRLSKDNTFNQNEQQQLWVFRIFKFPKIIAIK